MKIVKMMVLTLIGTWGLSSMLYANSTSNPTPEQVAENVATAQTTTLNQLATTLNATSWTNYLTIISDRNTLDILYVALTVTVYPNPDTVWEATYKSLQQGAALAFYDITSSRAYTLSDLVTFQDRLTLAKSTHPTDTRLGAIQYTLYLTFLYVALHAGNLTDYWSALRYGVPSGSSSGTTIFDLIIDNLPGQSVVAQFAAGGGIQNNPQLIFAFALIRGIDLTVKPENFIDKNVAQKPGDVETLTALSKFQNLFAMAQSKYRYFANYSEIQEKFYTGCLSLASNSNITTSIDAFWTMLSQSVPTGKNIFDIVLRQEYTPYNETTLTTAIYAALQRGISLATLKPPAIDNLSKLQGYITMAAGRFADNKYVAQNTYTQNVMFSTGISYISTGVSTVDEFWSILQNCAPQGKTILDIVLDPYYDYTTIATVGTALSQMFTKVASFTLKPDDLKRIQAYFTQALKKYASAFTATKAATQEKFALKCFSILSNDTTITTASSLISSLGSDGSNKNYLDLVLASDYVVQDQTALKSALITFFTRYAQILTAQDDIALLQSYLAQAKSKLDLDTAAIQNTLDLTLIVRLNAIKSQTPFDSGIKQLTQALALTAPVAANITNLVNAFGEAFDTATSMATLAQCDTLNSLLTAVPTWLSSSVTRLKQTISDRKAELQGSDTETQLITNLTTAASATKVSDITPYLTNAAAITTPLATNTSTLSTAFSNAFRHAVDIAANLTDLTTLKPILDATQTRTYLNSVWSTLNTAWTQKQQQLQTVAQDTKLIADLKAATTFAALLPLLTTALASTYTPANATELASIVNNAFTTAINAAASLDNINQLGTLLKTAPTYFTNNVAALTTSLTTKQQQLKAASDAAAAATAEQQLITNLKAATTFAALLPLLTTALASTYTPVNATELANTVANAFTTTINAAASLDNINQLGTLLKTAPTYFTNNVAALTTSLTTKQQQLKDASDAAAAATAEQQLITNLKAATTFAALLPLLTTALASTYTPANATELTSTVASAFSTAINAATSLTELTQLSGLLKTPPTYFSSNITSLNAALTTKQQQFQGTNTAAAEATIIANLKSTKTTLDALFSTFDTVLASTYKPIKLSTLKAAMLTGLTRTIALLTTNNYATAQSRITSYISSATPKYITTAQKTSLSKSLATKIKSIRTSLISTFVSKINSFKAAAASAITTKTKPAAVLAQRQTKFTSAIQTAATIIDAYVQLAPSASELALATLKSAFINFNASIIKLIQDQGFIKKSTSGKITTYKLVYNATATEPKTSLKKVLTFMSTTKFPQLSTAQKNIINPINASIA